MAANSETISRESTSWLFLSTFTIAIYYYCALVCKDDNWRSVNYQNEDSVHKFESDMKQLGIDNIPQYTYGQHSVASVHFCNDEFMFITRAIY